MIIINPKLGDKVLVSNTDSKLAEYRTQVETTGGEKEEEAAKNGDDEDDEKPSEEKSKKAPCEWKFFPENSNEYKSGFRIQLTHQKVAKKHKIKIKNKF